MIIARARKKIKYSVVLMNNVLKSVENRNLRLLK